MFWRLGANATPGARNLSVDGLTLVNAFAVNPGNAVILSIAPNTGQQGQTLRRPIRCHCPAQIHHIDQACATDDKNETLRLPLHRDDYRIA